jgi:predicted alpha/beta hydrolase
MQLHRIATQNGSIALRLFEPAANATAVIVIPSAMGVGQNFYARYAQWLAAQGFLVITFDYRGIGFSAPPTLRGYQMNIFDWAQDCAAVIDFATSTFPAAPLYWLGHSLGGQLLGLISNRDRIKRIVTIATGSGYWLQNSWPIRGMVWWLWFVLVPLSTRLTGYFPGKRLRKVGDLPRGVIEQWRRWCLNPEYVVGAEGEAVRAEYSSVQTPIMAISFTDDELMTEKSIRTLHGFYEGASINFRRIAPRDVGVRRIGHFGFFRPQFEQTLWPMVPRWLQEKEEGTVG